MLYAASRQDGGYHRRHRGGQTGLFPVSFCRIPEALTLLYFRDVPAACLMMRFSSGLGMFRFFLRETQ